MREHGWEFFEGPRVPFSCQLGPTSRVDVFIRRETAQTGHPSSASASFWLSSSGSFTFAAHALVGGGTAGRMPSRASSRAKSTSCARKMTSGIESDSSIGCCCTVCVVHSVRDVSTSCLLLPISALLLFGRFFAWALIEVRGIRRD